MTRSLPFYIVDVFAEARYSGNPLAVFCEASRLSAELMQRIADEMHFSESAFILSEIGRGDEYEVRIFTPKSEVPFAGHPTLGTAHVLRNERKATSRNRVVLRLKVGPVPVTFENNHLGWMEQNEPEFGECLEKEIVAPMLGLDPEEIDPRFPVEQVSTGLPHLVVPLKRLESLKKIRVDRDRYFTLIQNAWAKPVLVFCPEPHRVGNDISVRMFVDCFGIPEDPATGSGNGCLAAYLVKHRYWGKTDIDIRSEQGYEIGRPSLLLLRAAEEGGSIRVRVGGSSVTIARGEWDEPT